MAQVAPGPRVAQSVTARVAPGPLVTLAVVQRGLERGAVEGRRFSFSYAPPYSGGAALDASHGSVAQRPERPIRGARGFESRRIHHALSLLRSFQADSDLPPRIVPFRNVGDSGTRGGVKPGGCADGSYFSEHFGGSLRIHHHLNHQHSHPATVAGPCRSGQAAPSATRRQDKIRSFREARPMAIPDYRGQGGWLC